MLGIYDGNLELNRFRNFNYITCLTCRPQGFGRFLRGFGYLGGQLVEAGFDCGQTGVKASTRSMPSTRNLPVQPVLDTLQTGEIP